MFIWLIVFLSMVVYGRGVENKIAACYFMLIAIYLKLSFPNVPECSMEVESVWKFVR